MPMKLIPGYEDGGVVYKTRVCTGLTNDIDEQVGQYGEQNVVQAMNGSNSGTASADLFKITKDAITLVTDKPYTPKERGYKVLKIMPNADPIYFDVAEFPEGGALTNDGREFFLVMAPIKKADAITKIFTDQKRNDEKSFEKSVEDKLKQLDNMYKGSISYEYFDPSMFKNNELYYTGIFTSEDDNLVQTREEDLSSSTKQHQQSQPVDVDHELIKNYKEKLQKTAKNPTPLHKKPPVMQPQTASGVPTATITPQPGTIVSNNLQGNGAAVASASPYQNILDSWQKRDPKRTSNQKIKGGSTTPDVYDITFEYQSTNQTVIAQGVFNASTGSLALKGADNCCPKAYEQALDIYQDLNPATDALEIKTVNMTEDQAFEAFVAILDKGFVPCMDGNNNFNQAAMIKKLDGKQCDTYNKLLRKLDSTVQAKVNQAASVQATTSASPPVTDPTSTSTSTTTTNTAAASSTAPDDAIYLKPTNIGT